MSRTSPSTLLAAALAGALLCACAKHDAGHEEGAQRHVSSALANPSTFPLYSNSTVVTVVPVDSAQIFAAIRASEPHADLPPNYRGHEVIAETSASMAQLSAWLRTLRASPPQGLHDVSQTTTRSSGADGVSVNTEAGAKFDSRNGDRTVLVFTADPRKIRQQMGPAFALFDSYSAVPGMLRAPIDEQAKKQFGYSVTEMLDAKSPVGAAIATLKRLQDKDRRAILIIDESKSP